MPFDRHFLGSPLPLLFDLEQCSFCDGKVDCCHSDDNCGRSDGIVVAAMGLWTAQAELCRIQ
jgi:hypothetical protein